MKEIKHIYTGLIALIIPLMLLSACSSAPEKIGNLDLVKWRSDRGGCKGVRKGLESEFVKIQGELLGKHIDEVGFMLGRPDIHQLGARDQNFYVYFLDKGVHCTDITQKSAAQKAILRFNAVGLLSEITFQARPL
ncbi:hypothetical protein [Runella slithyformis]|uniref:Lipoprotein n=1 Tax=Runella slithyformis (strain ATCC 29530 / DSM 19594 / LMG 11500 / NCIMB 11436 / LSU 4) TaxID=761193 RepID=A0A7U4E8B3_RUNSL|nr:hypothetical protein [Runella slithyformis]AEI51528.1 hypothetical protein Runsl_5229 [Runella slithyformis DSM 19594]